MRERCEEHESCLLLHDFRLIDILYSQIIRNAAKQTTIPPEELDEQEQNREICSVSDSLSLPCDQVEAEVHPPISSPDPDPVQVDSVSTPSELEVSTCEKCQTYAERFAQLQDSCRKVKQRRGALQMEVNELRKINKDLRKVEIIYSRL